MSLCRQCALGLALLALGAAANASTITFDPLGGPNFTPYTGHSEAGYAIAPSSGWFQGQIAGNPTPSIFTNAATASIAVTLSGGGGFYFTSADFNDGNNSGTADYLITGLLGETNRFTLSGDIPLEFGSPVFNPFESLAIDTLIIEFTLNSSSSANIDNIVVSAVPVPAAVWLFGSAIAVLVSRRRRRTAPLL